MTQTATGHLQFERLELDLENWRDQLAQLSPYLSQGDLAKLARRWDLMRQNLDTVFLNYGHPLATLPMAMDGLPALMDLHQDELDATLEVLSTARKNLQAFISESEQRNPLLEQALTNDQKPDRMRRCLAKMRVIEDSFQARLQNIVTHIEQFNEGLDPEETLLATTQQVIAQGKRIEALKKANILLEEQKREMSRWLDESRQRLVKQPPMPVPNPNDIERIGKSLGAHSDTNTALALLFSNREKIGEARRYLENILDAKESEK